MAVVERGPQFGPGGGILVDPATVGRPIGDTSSSAVFVSELPKNYSGGAVPQSSKKTSKRPRNRLLKADLKGDSKAMSKATPAISSFPRYFFSSIKKRR